MLTESKPVLSDGTKIADLINLETREVSMRLLSDHEVYKIDRGEEDEMPLSDENLNAILFPKMAAEGLRDVYGGDFFNFTRNVNDIGRKYTAVWNGDTRSTFAGLDLQTLRNDFHEHGDDSDIVHFKDLRAQFRTHSVSAAGAPIGNDAQFGSGHGCNLLSMGRNEWYRKRI